MEQRSEAWFTARAGKVTASRIADMMAKTKTGWGASRKNYAAQLVAERLTGNVEQGYCNTAMQHGIDTEPLARAAYEQHALCKVEEIGFVDHPTIPLAGASPDGLIADDGLLEVKCPAVATHIDTLLDGKVPDKYRLQMLWQMACTGRAYCDYASYCPSLPEPMQLWVKRIERDDAAIAEIEEHAAEFLAEVEQTVERLQQQYVNELEAA